MTTLLIDGDILLYTIIHSTTIHPVFGDEWCGPWLDMRAAKIRLDAAISRLLETLEASKVIIALSDNKTCWRKDIYPKYKYARVGKKPGGWYELEEYLTDVYKVRRIPTMEADDVLGILATTHKGPTIIVSDDKDLRTIPGKLYRTRDKKLISISRRQADLYHLRQTLEGDRVDDYPGCPGVGEKTALRLLQPAADRRYWDKAARKAAWEIVVNTYESKGLTEEDALVQAQIARICRKSEYTTRTKKVKLWTPGT